MTCPRLQETEKERRRTNCRRGPHPHPRKRQTLLSRFQSQKWKKWKNICLSLKIGGFLLNWFFFFLCLSEIVFFKNYFHAIFRLIIHCIVTSFPLMETTAVWISLSLSSFSFSFSTLRLNKLSLFSFSDVGFEWEKKLTKRTFFNVVELCSIYQQKWEIEELFEFLPRLILKINTMLRWDEFNLVLGK